MLTPEQVAEGSLKPCPFCGSGPARPQGNGPGQASFSGVEAMMIGTGYHHVWCGTCGSQGSTEATEAEAIAAWNRRAILAKEPSHD